VVAQHRVDDKTNEITSVAPLFEGLDITDAVVSGAAIFTQQTIARFLVEETHADYLFMLKDNQPTLRSEIESLPREAFSPSRALHRR
jgi:predicted transposase YbfD/YdcC